MIARTKATAEQLEHYYGARGKKAPKRRARTPRMVEQKLFLDHGEWELQLPLYVEGNKEREGRFANAARCKPQVNATLLALQAYLRGIDRDWIDAIHFTRLTTGDDGLDDDNLPGAFKHVLDSTSLWIVKGSDITPQDRRNIGQFDGRLKKQWKETGKSWPPTYEQITKHEAHGIRIRLRLTPPSASSPAP
jgi:hypothetical protein